MIIWLPPLVTKRKVENTNGPTPLTMELCKIRWDEMMVDIDRVWKDDGK